jgi:hypothetical protein
MMVEANESPVPFMNFYDRLMKNPSWRVVQALFDFLASGNIPIDEDGYFYAYKSVTHDYLDWHSGTFNNRPGVTNELPRNEVSDDPKQACDEGFHIGTLKYARDFHTSGRYQIVICRVSPEDVVSVPFEKGSGKIRVCRYFVVGNMGTELPNTVLLKGDLPPVRPTAPRTPLTEDEATDVVTSPKVPSATEVHYFEPPEGVEGGQEESAYAECKLCSETMADGQHYHTFEKDDDTEDWCGICGLTADEEVHTVFTPEQAEPVEVEDDADPELHQVKLTTYSRPALVGLTIEKLRQLAKSLGIKNVKAVPNGKEGLADRIVALGSTTAPTEDLYTAELLANMPIDEVRRLATHHFKIVGASKIPGGKPALIKRILEIKN